MRVDTNCGQGVDFYRFFPTHAGVSPLVLGPASSIDGPRKLRFSQLLLPMWPQSFEWVGADTNRGWILFHTAQAIMRILFEGGYYSTCGYYSRKYGNDIHYTVSYQHTSFIAY